MLGPIRLSDKVNDFFEYAQTRSGLFHFITQKKWFIQTLFVPLQLDAHPSK